MDWDKLKASIGAIAPMLAATLGTPVAGVAVKVLCDTFGLSDKNLQTPDTFARALANASPDQLLALKQAESAHAEFMAKLGFNNVQALDRIAADDRANAREREIKTGDSTPRILSALVVVGYAAVQWFILANIVPSEMRDIVLRSMGTLDAALGLVLSYYFGSSAGRDAIGTRAGGGNG